MTTPFGVVFFDVDSTLVTIEGIDVLAEGDQRVAALTAAAMNGDIPLDEVYARRLELIRPSRQSVEALGKRYVESLVAGVEETFAALRNAGAHIHLITAGIAQAVAPLARHLRVPARAVHAVDLRFSEQGEYEDFDRRAFPARSRGKEIVVRDVRARTHGRAALVGDGASDLECLSAVDLFIGFGGVEVRPRVKENASVFVEEPDLRAVLPYLMDGAAA